MATPDPAAFAPLPDTQFHELQQLAAALRPEQLWWTSGYLAGLAQSGVQAPQAIPAASELAAATIVYATQTGNSRRIAEQLADRLAGQDVRLVSAGDYRLADLPKERQIVFVVSTHGEGDPPDDAVPFFERLLSKRAPKLEDVRYAVLSLGDSSYEKFCEVGRVLDERLAELGGQPLVDRVDCDVEFEDAAARWIDQLEADLDLSQPSNVVPMRAALPAAPRITRDAPLTGEVLEVQDITGRGSTSDTFHVEIAADGLAYEPGDSVGVWHDNPVLVVEQVLAATGLAGDAVVRVGDEETTLALALTSKRELTGLSRAVIERYVAVTRNDALEAWFGGLERAEQAEILDGWQFADLAKAYPGEVSAQALVDLLAPLKPRLYSIASALGGDEVHLTVSRVSYERDGEPRVGAASNWLGDLDAGAAVQLFVEPNAAFHLPEDPATPVIMIGAGTGVAPFRAFVQARSEAGAPGDNWLIFGHRNFRTDFLYQLEWQRALKGGDLARLDVAFSRDGDERRYVQHVVADQAAELMAWLDRGAHIYICGAIAMGKAVEAALVAAVDASGGDGEAVVSELKAERRLHRDVY
ncbi:MAG: flavodoxin domain-containing protein [Pseudomonadota bacterium]